MKNNRVIHFEIHASDPIKVAEFYTQVFGWKIEEWIPPNEVSVEEENRYWSVMTAPKGVKEMGIDGGIVVRKGPQPTGSEAVSAFIRVRCLNTSGLCPEDENTRCVLHGRWAIPILKKQPWCCVPNTSSALLRGYGHTTCFILYSTQQARRLTPCQLSSK